MQTSQVSKQEDREACQLPEDTDAVHVQSTRIVTREQLVRAVQHWGAVGEDGEPGMRLTRQASALVTVLALMDFEHESEVALPANGSLAGLLSAIDPDGGI